jgi:peptidoglycan biosynthesis protein MviN/MurJ (putative lipid II flippase)
MIATLAALGGAGQLTLFNNSWNIYMAIFYVLGASFATAIMPYVSKMHVSGEHASVKDSLTNSVTNVYSLSLYFSIFIFFFSPEIVKILYHFSNLSVLQENLMVNILQILSFSIATLNVVDVVRKYMYTIDMAYESIYVMVIFVPLTYILFLILNSYFFMTLSASSAIYALATALSLANMLTTFLVLILMNYKEKIFGKFVLLSMLRSSFVALLIFLAATFLQIFYSDYSTDQGFLTSFFLKLSTLLFLNIIFVIVFRDRIILEIFKILWTKKVK